MEMNANQSDQEDIETIVDDQTIKTSQICNRYRL